MDKKRTACSPTLGWVWHWARNSVPFARVKVRRPKVQVPIFFLSLVTDLRWAFACLPSTRRSSLTVTVTATFLVVTVPFWHPRLHYKGTWLWISSVLRVFIGDWSSSLTDLMWNFSCFLSTRRSSPKVAVTATFLVVAVPFCHPRLHCKGTWLWVSSVEQFSLTK